PSPLKVSSPLPSSLRSRSTSRPSPPLSAKSRSPRSRVFSNSTSRTRPARSRPGLLISRTVRVPSMLAPSTASSPISPSSLLTRPSLILPTARPTARSCSCLARSRSRVPSCSLPSSRLFSRVPRPRPASRPSC
ncbi:hypothetical protein BGZ52_011855, partial [Haplosporangium bisporale]